MAWIKTLLVPNRYDSLYLLIGVFCFLAAVSPFAAHHGNFSALGRAACTVFLVAISTCFIAIGAVVGLRKHAWRRVRLVFLLGAVLPLAAALGCFYLENNQTVLKSMMPLPAIVVPSARPSEFVLRELGFFYGAMLLLPFVSWLLFWLIRFGPKKIKTFFATRLNVSRSKLLVVIAGIMLLIGISNNVLQSVSSSYQQVLPNIILGAVVTVVSIGVSVVVVYFPTRLMASSLAGWKKRIAFLAIIGLLSLGLWFFFLCNLPNPILQHEELFGVIATVALALVYLMGVVSVADPNRVQPVVETEAQDKSDSVTEPVGITEPEAEASRPAESMVQRFPSVWSIGILLLLGGLFILPFRYDIVALANGDGFGKARRESRLRWSSRGQIIRTPNRGGTLYFDFDETTRPDVMALLDGDPAINWFFSGHAPQVDFSRLDKNLTLSQTNFDRGKITSTQLNDLLSQPVAFVRFDGSEVIDSGQRVAPASIDTLVFASSNGSLNRIEEILSLFESFENVDSVSIMMEIPEEAWPQLVRASEHALIEINLRQIPLGLSINQIKSTNGNFKFPLDWISSDQFALSREQVRWLEHSEANISSYWRLTDSQPRMLYDLIFAYPHRFDIWFSPLASPTTSWTHDLNLQTSPLASNFIFDRDDQGKPTSLFLPCGESNIGIEDLSELRILSFDECWLQKRFVTEVRMLVDLSRLTKLEHLSFSKGSSMDSIDFLASMKSLKHLQLPAVMRSSMVDRGFDACPSLETVTMFGPPDAKSVSEFRRLPNLKKLTIVDLLWINGSNDRVSEVNRELLAALRTQLPGVEITVVASMEFSPQVPDSFHEHRKPLQEKLRKKLRAESERPYK